MTFKYPMVFPPSQPQKVHLLYKRKNYNNFCFVFDNLFSAIINILQKTLLIFSKFDEYFELLQTACTEDDMTVQVARSGKEALNMLSNSNDYYDLILIDARSSKYIDAECISM